MPDLPHFYNIGILIHRAFVNLIGPSRAHEPVRFSARELMGPLELSAAHHSAAAPCISAHATCSERSPPSHEKWRVSHSNPGRGGVSHSSANRCSSWLQQIVLRTTGTMLLLIEYLPFVVLRLASNSCESISVNRQFEERARDRIGLSLEQ